MEHCLNILVKQIYDLKEDYIGLTECCNNMLEFSEYIISPKSNIHNKPLAKHLNFKLKKLYKVMTIIKDKINKI